MQFIIFKLINADKSNPHSLLDAFTLMTEYLININ